MSVADAGPYHSAGQIAILEAALEHRQKLFDEAVAAAKEAGIDMQFDEDGEEDNEDEEENEEEDE